MRVNYFFAPPLYSFRGVEAHISPHHMLWPISQEVITANTLSRINQNAGYDLPKGVYRITKRIEVQLDKIGFSSIRTVFVKNAD